MTALLRAAALLGCLMLAACSGMATARPPDTAAAAAPASPAASPAAAPAAAEPADPHADPLTQARVDCWMKVEHQRQIRDIDRRIVFVDKCVADTMKGKPPH